MEPVEQERKLRLHFIHRAQHAIKDVLLREEPATFSAAVQMAKDAERRQSILKSSSLSRVEGVVAAVPSMPAVFTVEKRLDTLEKTLATVAESLTQVLAVSKASPHPQSTTSRPGGAQRFSGNCFYCGIAGHQIAFCRKRQAELGQQQAQYRPFPGSCFKCGAGGHKASACPNPPAQNQRQGNA